MNEPPPPSASEKESERILRVGPVIGVGLPNLLSIGALLKITSYFGVGVNVGLIPSTKIPFYGDASISYQEYDLYGRIFPFAGGFFIGSGIGYEAVQGSITQDIDTSPYAEKYLSALPKVTGLELPNPVTNTSRASIRTMVLTPQLGYFYTTDIGFSIGLDVGAQIPVATSRVRFGTQFDVPYSSKIPDSIQEAINAEIKAQYIDPNNKKIEDTLTTIGKYTLPSINLRIGWLF